MVIEAKEISWKDFGEKLERDSKGNQKLFYKVLKTFRKGQRSVNLAIKSQEGNILNDEKNIMKRWKEYFENLLINSGTEQVQLDNEQNNPEEKTENCDNEGITMNELIETIRNLKNGKSPGHEE